MSNWEVVCRLREAIDYRESSAARQWQALRRQYLEQPWSLPPDDLLMGHTLAMRAALWPLGGASEALLDTVREAVAAAAVLSARLRLYEQLRLLSERCDPTGGLLLPAAEAERLSCVARLAPVSDGADDGSSELVAWLATVRSWSSTGAPPMPPPVAEDGCAGWLAEQVAAVVVWLALQRQEVAEAAAGAARLGARHWPGLLAQALERGGSAELVAECRQRSVVAASLRNALRGTARTLDGLRRSAEQVAGAAWNDSVAWWSAETAGWELACRVAEGAADWQAALGLPAVLTGTAAGHHTAPDAPTGAEAQGVARAHEMP